MLDLSTTTAFATSIREVQYGLVSPLPMLNSFRNRSVLEDLESLSRSDLETD